MKAQLQHDQVKEERGSLKEEKVCKSEELKT